MALQDQLDLISSPIQGYEGFSYWRTQHEHVDIDLDGADLSKKELNSVLLNTGRYTNFFAASPSPVSSIFTSKVSLHDTNFSYSTLTHAKFSGADLAGANFSEADLTGADFTDTNISGANFSGAILTDTVFRRAIVDSKTMFWDCEVSRKTDFSGVGLSAARINPEIRALMEYNIRRFSWDHWLFCGTPLRELTYGETIYFRDQSYLHPPQNWPVYRKWSVYRILTRPAALFFWISDYGRSTTRVFLSFIAFSAAFALIYFLAAIFSSPGSTPGVIHNLIPDGQPLDVIQLFVRSLYFSVVTMTTLGYGDIYVEPKSLIGHILVILQVLLGYVLLGAIITRFSILFTSLGPSARFPDEIRWGRLLGHTPQRYLTLGAKRVLEWGKALIKSILRRKDST